MPARKIKALVNQRRLKKPDDNFRGEWPRLNFRNVFHFETAGEPVLVTDPTYLADVFNSHGSDASFLREHGVIIGNFGCGGGPIWWQEPFVFFPTSWEIEDYEAPRGVEVLAEEIGTDSCTFIFLPLPKGLSRSLRKEVNQLLREGNAASLKLPAGKWEVFYEQWDTNEEDNVKEHFRNIVLKWQAPSSLT